MQIAIDGPAGAGKSTIAKLIAENEGLLYLDTGAMYRAVTYGVFKADIDWEDKPAIIELAKKCMICFDGSHVFLNGEDVTAEIRLPEITNHTGAVAGIPEVRVILVKEQQRIAAEQSVVMDGRDIGSVVLPGAEFKFYLDASLEERADRRYKEFIAKGLNISLDEVKSDIEKRDYDCIHRDASPLICVEDAIYIDTTGKTIPEVCSEISALIHQG